MPTPFVTASSLQPPRGVQNGPHLPELQISRNVMGQIRTLMLCATSSSEHIANLHLIDQPSTRTTSPVMKISSLSLPDATTPQVGIPVVLTAGPSQFVHPRRWNALSLPLSAFASLPDGNPVVTFHTRLRTFVFSLDEPEAFDAHDGRRLAQTALGIVLAGGSLLRQDETAGLLRKRGSAFEAVLVDDGEADEGVWTLGGDHAELWKALVGLAELRAKRRNKKIGKREASSWVAGEVAVLHFDENGTAWCRRGWMRVLCGRTGVEYYAGEVRESAGRHTGQFVRQRTNTQQSKTREQNRASGTNVETSRARRRPTPMERDAMRNRSKQIEPLERTPVVELNCATGEATEVTRTLPSAEVDTADRERASFSAQEPLLPDEDLTAYQDLQPSSDDDLEGSDEDSVMEAMCRKYLNASYADEVRRRLERLS